MTGVALLAAVGASTSEASIHHGATANAAAGGTINGAGSTFAQPIYQQWGSNLASSGLRVVFNGVGSGAGVAQLFQGTVDFAGSDPFVPASDGTKMGKGQVFDFPTAFGAITVSYNLPGIKSGLKLDGATIANIFMGKIKTWNDPAIKKLNKGVKLPSTPITVVHRNDSSGTTAEFTEFLDDYSPTWKKQVGSDKEVKWPLGTGAKGNPGVAAAVKQTTGAIGYVEAAYALQNHFTFAAVKNASGKFVLPTLAATSAVTQGLKIPKDLGINVINSKGKAAYPIAGQTFLVAYKDMCKAGISKATALGVKKFFTYALGPGQKVLTKLAYAPLPKNLQKLDMKQVNQFKCNGAKL